MKENDRRHIPHSLRPVAAVAAALAQRAQGKPIREKD